MKKLYPLLFITVFILTTVSSSWALWGSPTRVEGTVKSVGGNVLTITKESPQGQRIQEMNFEINDDTKFEKVASLNELQAGDKIEVHYKEDGARKIVTQVSKEATTDFSERMNKKENAY